MQGCSCVVGRFAPPHCPPCFRLVLSRVNSLLFYSLRLFTVYYVFYNYLSVVVFVHSRATAFQVRSGMGAYAGAAHRRVHLCDGTPSAFVWPSPRQTPSPPCPYPSDRTPPDATMKRVDAPRHGPAPRISTKKIRWAGSSGGSCATCP